MTAWGCYICCLSPVFLRVTRDNIAASVECFVVGMDSYVVYSKDTSSLYLKYEIKVSQEPVRCYMPLVVLKPSSQRLM